MSYFWHSDLNAITVNSKSEFWIFKGDLCVRTNSAGNQVTAGPAQITDEWPVLRDTPFASDLDAVHHTDGYWFFKGDECAKTNDAGDAYMVPPSRIIDQWTILKDL
ncbi:hypothetical protein [Actinophytocola sp.]|uniref:hypothetical protein n=1 Tax=Actinophytocola sp. TaxID=1872138 RepID=UPI002ED35CDF